MIKPYTIVNFDDVTRESIKEHNPKWFEIPDHKEYSFWRFRPRKNKHIIDIIYLYMKDP